MFPYLCSNYKPLKVHPGVVLSILKFHSRLDNPNDRVVGALIGSEREKFIEIRECFPIVRNIVEEVVKEENKEEVEGEGEAEKVVEEVRKKKKSAIDEQRALNFSSLYRQLYPRQNLLGWFSTSTEINPDEDFDITESLMKNTSKPILLLVDPYSKEDLKGYQFQQLKIKRGDVLGMIHFPLKVDFVMNENEKTALSQYITYGKELSNVCELDLFKREVRCLMNRIEKLQGFINNDDTEPNKLDVKLNIARTEGLLYTHTFKEKHFDEKLDSLLTLIYLTNICQAHVEVLERMYQKVVIEPMLQKDQSRVEEDKKN